MYKRIQKGSGAKSYMRKGFLIYEYDFAPDPLWISWYEENFILFFYSVGMYVLCERNQTTAKKAWSSINHCILSVTNNPARSTEEKSMQFGE
jgi:hypothetical protein